MHVSNECHFLPLSVVSYWYYGPLCFDITIVVMYLGSIYQHVASVILLYNVRSTA
jgi:hypothetical protein